MSKRTKKNNNYNIDILNALENEFGLTKQFIRQCIRKEKHSTTAQTIEKKYRQLLAETKEPINKFKANPVN